MKRLFALTVSFLASSVALAAGVTANTIDYAAYTWSATPCGVMLSVYAGPDSRGFSWQTDSSVTAGGVDLLKGSYGESDADRFANQGTHIAATCYTGGASGVQWSSPVVHTFVAKVEGLESGATYSYRVGGADGFAYGTFTVRPADETITVVNLNDVQTKDASLYYKAENTFDVAAETAGGAAAIDFILDGGDFIDGIFRNAGDNSTSTDNTKLLNQWSMAADTATPYFPGVPWLHAAGNHDNSIYDYERNDATSRRVVMEDFKVNCSSLLGCHSFDYGNLHVTTIHDWGDTSWQDKHSRITNWLKADLEASKANAAITWRVVVMHKGPYTTGDNLRGGSPYAENAFCKAIIQNIATLCSSNDVDLVLQAHDHTYSKTLPYRWSGCGYTTSETDAEQINLAPETVTFAGRTYDVEPEGTYYVAAGCAGHRVGEMSQYADRDGARSYTNRVLKVVTGKIAVDSPYAKRGDDASADVGKQMFGVLRVNGNRLDYDFYVAEADGTATLYDSLGILKGDGPGLKGVGGFVDFSELPAATETLNPLANDAGLLVDDSGAPVTNRFWSWTGDGTAGLAITDEGLSGDGRCLSYSTDEAILFRNFSALTSADPVDGLGQPVELPDPGTLLTATTVRFDRSNVLPSAEDVAADKLIVGIYGNAFYAFAGFAGANGLEMRAFRLSLTVTDAWLAQYHKLAVRAYSNASGMVPGFLVEIDERLMRVAAVAPVEYDMLGAETAADAGYLGVDSVSDRLAGAWADRRLLLGFQTGTTLSSVGFQGTGTVDDIFMSGKRGNQTGGHGLLLQVR